MAVNQKTIVMTPEGRVSFPHLFKPNRVPGSTKDTYSVILLFPKKTTKLDELEDALFAAADDVWGPEEKWPKKMNAWPIGDGDADEGKDPNTGEARIGYAGNWFIKASTNVEFFTPATSIVGPDVKPIINPADIYPGCWGRMQVKARAYDAAKSVTNGLSFALDHFQKTRDDKPFTARKSADKVFGPVGSSTATAAPGGGRRRSAPAPEPEADDGDGGF